MILIISLFIELGGPRARWVASSQKVLGPLAYVFVAVSFPSLKIDLSDDIQNFGKTRVGRRSLYPIQGPIAEICFSRTEVLDCFPFTLGLLRLSRSNERGFRNYFRYFFAVLVVFRIG